MYEQLKDESTFDINYNLQQAYKNVKNQLDKLQKLSVIVSDALNTKKLDTTSPVYLCVKDIKNQKFFEVVSSLINAPLMQALYLSLKHFYNFSMKDDVSLDEKYRFNEKNRKLYKDYISFVVNKLANSYNS